MTDWKTKEESKLFNVATELNILAQFKLKKLDLVPDRGDLTCYGNLILTNCFRDFPTHAGKQERKLHVSSYFMVFSIEIVIQVPIN